MIDLLSKLDDRMNPVMVKELRQGTQGHPLASMLLLFLTAAVGFFGWLVLGEGREAGLNGTDGLNAFRGLRWLTLAVAALVLPSHANHRVIRERKSHDDELMIAAAGGGRYVRGKALAVLAVSAMVYTAALPFAAWAMLMRGIDAAGIVLIFTADLTTAAFCGFMGIASACTQGTLLHRLLILPPSICGLGAVAGGDMFLYFQTIRHGAGWLFTPVRLIGMGGFFFVSALLTMTACAIAARSLDPRGGGRGRRRAVRITPGRRSMSETPLRATARQRGTP